jgi:hypothetical protein
LIENKAKSEAEESPSDSSPAAPKHRRGATLSHHRILHTLAHEFHRHRPPFTRLITLHQSTQDTETSSRLKKPSQKPDSTVSFLLPPKRSEPRRPEKFPHLPICNFQCEVAFSNAHLRGYGSDLHKSGLSGGIFSKKKSSSSRVVSALHAGARQRLGAPLKRTT